MKKQYRPKLAFFDFTDCEGCQLQIANMGEAFVQLTELFEIVNFREIASEAGEDYDIAVVEGSISTDNDVTRIKKIRQKAKVLVAIGACATTGGVNGIKNRSSLFINTIRVMPLHEVVRVDYTIHCCPPYIPEIVAVFKCILTGKPYAVPNYPVCVECKMNENVCRYEKDQECLGPVTRAGCNSWCVNYGNRCYGCRGLLENPAADAQKDILVKYGLKVEDILAHFTLYNESLGEKYDQEFK